MGSDIRLRQKEREGASDPDPRDAAQCVCKQDVINTGNWPASQ